jgi:hypothetical protein
MIKNILRMDNITEEHYKSKDVTIFSIPIEKKGNIIGFIHVFSKKGGEVYRTLYEDRSGFSQENGGTIKMKTANNQYIASIDCKVIDIGKMSMKITDVAPHSNIKIKTRVELPDPNNTSWLSCITECYRVAKEACGSESSCEFLCNMVDIVGRGACTLSIAAACAIYCM